MFLRGTIAILVLVSSAAFAEDKPAPHNSTVLCRSKNTVRTVRIFDKGHSCKAVYSKDGEEKVVATAKSLAMCTDVSNKIKKNLEENNWRCKDISENRISSNY